MGKRYSLIGTLSENVNKTFRVETKFFNIINRFSDVKKFPILINNFNRLEYLKQQIDWLQRCGYKNIHIIDNASTYTPLLNFYKNAPATVYFLDRNLGHEAYWRSHLFQRFGKYFHVLTDPDVLPDENTPTDFMFHFYSVLKQHNHIKKVGFGLRIDDLPDYYPKKNEVVKWENQFLNNNVGEGLYKARIDTTFALYKPGAFLQCWEETLRTGYPYLLRHMPWYENPNQLSDETKFYLSEISEVSTWYKSLLGEEHRYA